MVSNQWSRKLDSAKRARPSAASLVCAHLVRAVAHFSLLEILKVESSES